MPVCSRRPITFLQSLVEARSRLFGEPVHPYSTKLGQITCVVLAGLVFGVFEPVEHFDDEAFPAPPGPVLLQGLAGMHACAELECGAVHGCFQIAGRLDQAAAACGVPDYENAHRRLHLLVLLPEFPVSFLHGAILYASAGRRSNRISARQTGAGARLPGERDVGALAAQDSLEDYGQQEHAALAFDHAAERHSLAPFEHYLEAVVPEAPTFYRLLPDADNIVSKKLSLPAERPDTGEDLEKRGIISREIKDDRPVRVNYELTEFGNGLYEIFLPVLIYYVLPKKLRNKL